MRRSVVCLAWALVMTSMAAGQAPDTQGEKRAPATPAPAAPATGPTVTGLVVSEATGAPIPQARVELFALLDPEASRQRRLDGNLIPEPLAAGTTGDDGRFRLAAPASTRIMVVAQAPGHARARGGAHIVTGSSHAEHGAGTIELPAGRRLSGKVIGPDGRPAAGAAVVATIPRDAAPGGAGAGFARRIPRARRWAAFPVTSVTAEDGSFDLESVPDRPVTVRVYAVGFATALLEDVRATTAIAVRLEKGHDLAGKVVAPDGKTAVSGAWVLVGEEGWDGIGRTAQDGTFKLKLLRAGTASITATVSSTLVGEAAASLSAADSKPGGRATWAPSAPLKTSLPVAPTSGGPEAPVTLKLRPGGIVRARAADASTLEPVTGSTLFLSGAGEAAPRPAVTKAEGEAVFTGVPVGTFGLRAEAQGYLGEALPRLSLAVGQTRAVSAALRQAAALEGTVRDATGRPVAGVQLDVAGPPPIARSLPVPIFIPLGIDPVSSDAEGRFLLERLPSGSELKLTAAGSGFAPWEMTGIKLRAGERRSGFEVLLEAGSIITGRLLDREGAPIGGGSVTAARRREGAAGGMVFQIGVSGRGAGRGGMGGEEELPAVLTGEDGTFRVHGARAGIWTLRTLAAGYAPQTVAGLKLEEGARKLDAGNIVLEPGASLRGRVTSTAGEPIPFASGRVMQEFTTLSEFTTGSDGSFVSGDLAAGGLVTLTVEAEGFAAVEKAGISPPVDDLVIVLPPSSRVTGQVLDRESRRPIPDFAIGVTRSRSGGAGGMMMNMAMAGSEVPFHTEDGAFTVDDVDPGKISITAHAPGYRESIMRDLAVPEGEDLTGVTLLMDRAASISGTVVDSNSKPVPHVSVEKKEAASGPGMRLRMGGGAVTDADGEFTLEGLDRGPVTLSFTHPEYEPAERDVDTSSDVSRLRVTLSRGAELVGMVVREADGSAVSDATVTAIAAGSDRFSGARSVSTNPDGSFVLEAMSPGRYTLRAESTGLKAAVAENVVVASGSAPPPIELRLGGGATLTGSVMGARPDELARLTVRAFTSGGGLGVSAAVDAEGRFEMKGLPAGTMTLMASSGLMGGRSVSKSVLIPDGEVAVETVIEFPRGSTVTGTVTRGGKPVEGASVMFLHKTSRSNSTATTDSDGRYTADDLDNGEYTVHVMQFSSGLSHDRQLSLSSDKQLDIELPLATLSGTVTDAATGQPLEGASITIKEEGSAAPSGGSGFLLQRGARTDTTGRYALEGIGEGAYTVTARREGYGFESRPVTMAVSGEIEDVSFELAKVPALTFRVLDAGSGTQLETISALVLTGGSGDPLAPAGSGSAVIVRDNLSSDASRLFHLDSLQPGAYRLVLGGNGIATQTFHAVTVPAQEMSFTVRPGGSLEISVEGLETGQTARGVLLDDQGRPIHVGTFLPEPSFTIRPEALVLRNLPSGAYRLRVSAPPNASVDVPVEIKPGDLAKVSIP